MRYLPADALDFDAREQISRVFVVGFYQWLKYFTKDVELLTRALAHMFDLSKFQVAVEGGTIAAITACTDGVKPPIRLDKAELRRHLGLVRGLLAYSMLKTNLQEHGYPFEIPPRTGSIEFVATAPEFRGKGVAFALIEHVMKTCGYVEYVLEVADTNTVAIRLYERLGFKEFHRVPEKHPKQSGLNNYVYMKREMGAV
ncbi:MAG: GNAT family N-acetyltransferase [Oscillospiraceae bacterium]|jgi:ribosomal protein S18 acetylase RimI-like enzyme|nr:GNAT family N-acetyltransferase [Oscillospiraceae bacterium]